MLPKKGGLLQLTNATIHILLATEQCPSFAITNPQTSLYFKAVHKEKGKAQ